MSSGNRGHFRTSFLPIWLPMASHLLATPHGPTALVRAQEAEENHLLPARVFAWFRHLGHTLPCQGRAGASESRRAQRLLVLAHRALVLALTGGVNLLLPEPGFEAPFSLKQSLVNLATLAVTLAPPQSWLGVASFRRALCASTLHPIPGVSDARG